MTTNRTAAPGLSFFAEVSVDVGPPVDVGTTPEGHRRIVPITGGTFHGPHVSGKVLPGGADYQILRSRELTELDARYALETDAGQRVYVHNTALRHGTEEDIERLNRGEDVPPDRIYFRCWPRLTSSPPALSWLNNRLAIGTGERHPDQVVVRIFLID
ncbi:DUF3237 domain-containing protein [Arthrobacter sp. MI7-26]|uniref:DUF3237 domain-containing protein n=1 Tax=Arthrobacter sp. MI7-26 TaxID=2993653 RepID=UPI0022493E76|nr:DUF3237 domain-containing protein [Arthrobacter sp. MI7-26]MCX2746541.1 DUF3237 domain-containing protein [Arthrobacter sp. MI7-26]